MGIFERVFSEQWCGREVCVGGVFWRVLGCDGGVEVNKGVWIGGYLGVGGGILLGVSRFKRVGLGVGIGIFKRIGGGILLGGVLCGVVAGSVVAGDHHKCEQEKKCGRGKTFGLVHGRRRLLWALGGRTGKDLEAGQVFL